MPANTFGSFEDSIEQGISQVTQQAKQQAATTFQTVATQTTGSTFATSSAHPASADSVTQAEVKPVTDQFNETASNSQQNQAQNPQDDAKSLQEKKQLEERDYVDREKKLKDTRQRLQQLHNQVYYDPTFNRRKKEPTIQEKLEQEEQVKQQKQMVELEERKKKEPSLALHQAQTRAEINRGASG
jgi:hypothetical protein